MLGYALIALATLVAMVASNPYCPVTHVPECSCRNVFMRRFYITCSAYVAEDIPPFDVSNLTHASLHFRDGSRVHRVRTDAFVSVKVQALHLQELGIEEVQDGAFTGLGTVLRELHLDMNKIDTLPGNIVEFYIDVS